MDLLLPSAGSDGKPRAYPLNTEAGLEILLLLVREEEPLPSSYDDQLKKLLDTLVPEFRKCQVRNRHVLHEFTCKTNCVRNAPGMRLGHPKVIDNPLSRVKLRLIEKLGDRFDLIAGLIFANDGP
jgi:hypothetical protein